MKFIFGTKKFRDSVNRFAFWKCGAITYGIILNISCRCQTGKILYSGNIGF